MIKPEDYLGHWKLNGNLKDYSGRGNDLIAFGTAYSWTKSHFGNVCVNTKDSTSLKTLSSSDLVTNEFTVYGWYKYNNITANYNWIINSVPGGTTSDGLFSFGHRQVDNKMYLFVEKADNSSYNFINTTSAITDKKWHFVAGTFKDYESYQILTLVVDDNVYTKSISDGINQPSTVNMTMAYSGYAGNDAEYYDIAYLKKALSAEELQRIRRSAQPTPKPKPLYFPEKPVITDGLVGAWGFGNNPLKDESTVGNDLNSLKGSPAIGNGFVRGNSSGGAVTSANVTTPGVRPDNDFEAYCWVRIDGTTGDSTQTPFSMGYENTSPWSDFRPLFSFYNATNVLGARRYKNDGTASWELKGKTIEFGKYYFVRLRHYSDGTYKVYVNNEEASEYCLGYCAGSKSVLGFSSSFTAPNIRAINGEVRNACVFNRHLTDAEADQIYRTTVPDDTLVLDWQGRDMSRYQRTPTIFGSPKFGIKSRFEGTEDRVEYPSINAGDEYTVNLWVKPDSTSDPASNFFHLNTYQFFRPNARTKLYIGCGSYWTIEDFFESGQWVLMTFVSDGTTQYVYKNGELQDSRTASYTANGNVYIGGYQSTGYPLRGEIADVKIYSEAKSAEWIKNYYKSTRGLY